jgi:hypothetical protein
MNRPIDHRTSNITPVQSTQVHNAAQATPLPAATVATAQHQFGQYNGAVIFVLPRGAQRGGGAAAGKGPTARRGDKSNPNNVKRNARRSRTTTIDPDNDDFALPPEDDDDVALSAELGSSFSQSPRQPIVAEGDTGPEKGVQAKGRKAARRVPVDDAWAVAALAQGKADAVVGSFIKKMMALADGASGARGGPLRSTRRILQADTATVLRVLGPLGLAGQNAPARIRSLLIETAHEVGRRPAATAEARTINLLMFPKLLNLARYCVLLQHAVRIDRVGLFGGFALPFRLVPQGSTAPASQGLPKPPAP